jgi:hypothetical protein
MNVKINHYMNQASYTATAGGKSSESYAGGRIGSEGKSGRQRLNTFKKTKNDIMQ